MISILLIVCNTLSTIHPFLMKQIVDVDFQASNVQTTLLKLVFAYTLVHIACAISKNIRNIKVNRLMAKMLKDIREKII